MSKVLFIEPPPTIDWTVESRISKAGRRHPCVACPSSKAHRGGMRWDAGYPELVMGSCAHAEPHRQTRADGRL